MNINIWKSIRVFLIVTVLMGTQAVSAFASEMSITDTANNTQVQTDVTDSNSSVPVEDTGTTQNNTAVYYDSNVIEQNTYDSETITYDGTTQSGQSTQGSGIVSNIESINSALDGFEFGTGLTISTNDNGVKRVFQNILSTALSYIVPIILGGYFVITAFMDWAVAIIPPLEGILSKAKCDWMLSGDVGLAKEKKFFAYCKARMVPVVIFISILILVTMDLHIVIGNFLGKALAYFILQILAGLKNLLNSFSV